MILERYELPQLAEMTVLDGENETAPGSTISAPATSGPLIPIPVIVEEC